MEFWNCLILSKFSELLLIKITLATCFYGMSFWGWSCQSSKESKKTMLYNKWFLKLPISSGKSSSLADLEEIFLKIESNSKEELMRVFSFLNFFSTVKLWVISHGTQSLLDVFYRININIISVQSKKSDIKFTEDADWI